MCNNLQVIDIEIFALPLQVQKGNWVLRYSIWKPWYHNQALQPHAELVVLEFCGEKPVPGWGKVIHLLDVVLIKLTSCSHEDVPTWTSLTLSILAVTMCTPATRAWAASATEMSPAINFCLINWIATGDPIDGIASRIQCLKISVDIFCFTRSQSVVQATAFTETLPESWLGLELRPDGFNILQAGCT